MNNSFFVLLSGVNDLDKKGGYSLPKVHLFDVCFDKFLNLKAHRFLF